MTTQTIVKTYTDPTTANALIAEAQAQVPPASKISWIHTDCSFADPSLSDADKAAFVPTYTMTITFDVPAA